MDGAGNGGYLKDEQTVGAWHSEYKCLMNGTHENYQFRFDAHDPIKNLRDNTRFCLWCQELVTMRLLERTDKLLEPGDPTDITAQGQTWWARWVEELRPNYLELFDVRSRSPTPRLATPRSHLGPRVSRSGNPTSTRSRQPRRQPHRHPRRSWPTTSSSS